MDFGPLRMIVMIGLMGMTYLIVMVLSLVLWDIVLEMTMPNAYRMQHHGPSKF